MDAPRACWRIRRLSTKSRDDLLLVRIEPPLVGQKYGLGGEDIHEVIVATRHQGASLFPISEWPLYVHVARLKVAVPENRDRLEPDEFDSIAWAELYPTREDARLKR
ncbi:MAG: hypothetical protein IT562_11225 [Alphaproteobacteria bacterium]|nr:hypothetical protein [Alphaproteobacteria bacterium]